MKSTRAEIATIVLCGLALLLSGCPTVPAAHVVVAPTGDATAAQLAAQQATIDELKTETATAKELAQRASGGVEGARDANTHNPDGLPKEAVAAQLAEAASALPEPTAEQKLEKANQNARILAGELASVKAEMGQAMSENQALRASLAAVEQRAIEAEKTALASKATAEKERAEAAAKLQRQFDAMTKQIQAAQDEAGKAANTRLGWVLLGLGAALTLAGAGIAFITKGLEWQRAAIAAAFGGACFGLYWTMNQWWFKWLVIVTVACAVAAAIWWLVKMGRSAQRSKEADEAEDTLKKIIPVLDATPLPEITGKLSVAMNDNHKALVHELRAETKREKVTP
jgi:uncharacterized membrane protein/regulator of replication initiation timing